MEDTGFVISTFGSPAYVDLQLKLHKGKWGHDCIVSDDGSQDQRLQEVCDKWEVPLIGLNAPWLGHQKGDAKSLSRLVEHFTDKTFIFKVSRRFLWLKDFSKELPESDYTKSPFLSDWWVPNSKWESNKAFTSCCYGIYNKAVQAELRNVLLKFPDYISELPRGGFFVEPVLFKVFKAFFKEPLTIWRQLYKERGREQVGEDVLWKNNASPYKYKLLADLLDLNWSL